MRSIDDLLEEARLLPPDARRVLRDRLDESLHEAQPETVDDGPYASLLKSAGTASSPSADVARRKNEHLAQIYAGKRRSR